MVCETGVLSLATCFTIHHPSFIIIHNFQIIILNISLILIHLSSNVSILKVNSFWCRPYRHQHQGKEYNWVFTYRFFSNLKTTQSRPHNHFSAGTLGDTITTTPEQLQFQIWVKTCKTHKPFTYLHNHKNVAASTIRSRLSAIAYFHKIQGVASPNANSYVTTSYYAHTTKSHNPYKKTPFSHPRVYPHSRYNKSCFRLLFCLDVRRPPNP